MHIHSGPVSELKPFGEQDINAETILCEGICESCGLTYFAEITF